MSGLVVFRSLREAVCQGYQIAERTTDDYLVRIKTPRGGSTALVETGSGLIDSQRHHVGQ
jgi:hypothetical protein